MLHLSKGQGYWLYGEDTDMRKGFDRLHGLVKDQMHQDIFRGDIYIFINKRRNQIKLLHWEGDGLSMYYKRLEKGTYELPRGTIQGGGITISSEQLQYILSGIILNSIKRRKRYVHTGNLHDEKTLCNNT
ncbi:MAG: IS66 family insertion sequence element accessory protein TnpB [Saprospiraceae bacterium]|nr:IS66 family insertion sequence element accessory protein TnpB [Saprospiraceae bacterium]